MVSPIGKNGRGLSGQGSANGGAGSHADHRLSARTSHSESGSRLEVHSNPRLPDQETAIGLGHYRGVAAYGLLQHAAEQLPSREAVIYGEQTLTYRDLDAEAIRCAAMLQRLGVRAGDRVGILLPNVPEFIIAANGIWRAGAIVLAISPLMVESEVASLIRKTKCRYVIGLDLLAHLLDEVDPDEFLDADETPFTTLLVSIRRHLPAHKQLGYLLRRGFQWLRSRPRGGNRTAGWFWDEITKVERPWTPVEIAPETDPAYILATGGTTGDPKAVTLSHQNMVANAWQQYVWNRKSFGSETMLGVLPFFHSYGMSATVMGGAAMGATLVLHHRFNTAQVIRLIESHRPSVFHAVPAMLVAMNARLREKPGHRLDSLRRVISGGAPLDPAVAQEFAGHCGSETDGCHVVEGFGLSESSPVTHVGDLFDEPRYGCIGLPLPETECRIIDSNRLPGQPIRDVSRGEIGELCIRGPQVMLGYWNDSESTRETIVDGWLLTGDLAFIRPDGYYTITGRKKDLIITSGFNVYPGEVEEVLRDAPDVKDAAVIGRPDAIRGETVHAHIVTRSGEAPDIEAIQSHCRRKLSAHKRPREYTHCQTDLPRNFLGKVIRRKLREEAK